MPTQLNCGVELRIAVCIEFATLATVSTSLDESEQFADNEVELRRVGGVNAAMTQPSPVVTELLLGLLHWLQYRIIVNWVTTADGRVHTADTTQLDSRVASASAVCIWHYTCQNQCVLPRWPIQYTHYATDSIEAVWH